MQWPRLNDGTARPVSSMPPAVVLLRFGTLALRTMKEGRAVWGNARPSLKPGGSAPVSRSTSLHVEEFSDPSLSQNRGSNSLRYADEFLKVKSLSTRQMRLSIVDRF
jgi:hypothetical protein